MTVRLIPRLRVASDAERVADRNAARLLRAMLGAVDSAERDRLASEAVREVIIAERARARRVARRNRVIAWALGLLVTCWAALAMLFVMHDRIDFVLRSAPIMGIPLGACCGLLVAQWQRRPLSKRGRRSGRTPKGSGA